MKMTSSEVESVLAALRDVKNPTTLVAVAVVTGAIVRILKTKKFGDLLDRVPVSWVKRIPSWLLPWTAVAFAFLITFLDGWLNGKMPLPDALVAGIVGSVLGGGAAIGGHETVVRQISNMVGKGDGPDDERKTPTVEDAKPPPTPPASNRTVFVAGGLMICAFFVASCGILTPKNVTDLVLKAADIACLEEGKGANIVDPDAAAVACGIAQDPVLRDIIRRLVAQREAAKRNGFVWGGDAGVESKDGGR